MENKQESCLQDEERQKCEIWTRVMGYFRPLKDFNKGKQSEYEERKWFCEQKASRSSKVKSNVA